MKAVITEIRNGKAAVLTDDGRFLEIRNRGYQIGQTIDYPVQKQPFFRPAAVWSLAAAVCAILIAFGFYLYQTPFSVVSLDINPSIEYTLNIFDRVLSVQGVNQDGKDLLAEMDSSLRNDTIDEAVAATIQQLSQDQYITQDQENTIMISIYAQDESHASRLADSLQSKFENDRLHVQSITVTRQQLDSAHAAGTSAGKLSLVQELQSAAEGKENIVTEEWLEKPVREILSELDRLQNSSTEESPQPLESQPVQPEATAQDQPEQQATSAPAAAPEENSGEPNSSGIPEQPGSGMGASAPAQ